MLRLAVRNVFRHRLRTSLTLAAIMSGVVGLILSGGFIEDTFIQLREATVHSQLGHLQIYKTGYYARGSQTPYQFIMDEPTQLLLATKALPQVKDTMARLNFAGVLNNGRVDLPIRGEGLEADKESKLGSSLMLTAGRQLNGNDAYGVLLGEGIANASGLRPGDRATLVVGTANGALNNMDFEVVGIFRSFSRDYDARAVRIPLRAAQDLLDTRGANAIVLSLEDTRLTDEVAAILAQKLDSRAYEVRTWNQLADYYEKTVALYRRQFAVLQVIILFAVVLSVVNSVNIAVFERTGEYGTLMALGNRSNNVFRLIVSECLLLGLIGGAGGALLGMLLAWGISAFGIPMPPPPNSNSGYTALIRVVPWVVVNAFLIGFVATAIAALPPAFRAARLPIVDALRQNA